VVDRCGIGDVSSADRKHQSVFLPLCPPSELSANFSLLASLSGTRIISTPETPLPHTGCAAERVPCRPPPVRRSCGSDPARNMTHAYTASMSIGHNPTHAKCCWWWWWCLLSTQCPHLHVVMLDCETVRIYLSTYLLITILRYRSACGLCCSITLLHISSEEAHPQSPTFTFISTHIFENIRRHFQLLESIDKRDGHRGGYRTRVSASGWVE